MNAKHGLKLAGLLFLVPCVALSVDPPSVLADCVGIVDASHRLACFDFLAASRARENSLKLDAGAVEAASAQKPVIPLAAQDEKKKAYSLASHWELESKHKHRTFSFRPHKGNYVLFANYSSSPNNAPVNQRTGPVQQDYLLSSTELKFQLSFKMKLLENLGNLPADVWFGYTQESHWQLYNKKASRPIRETDYQPELMMVVPTNFNVFGLRARFVNLGMVHQSNGREAGFSRSWNRIYTQLGMEKENFTLSGRLWKRLNENRTKDDNPDITDYMGHGDVTVSYRSRGHVYSLLARRNFHTGRGATKLGWEFPLAENAKGYVEAFSGYGHSLIDYNHFQNAIGVGLAFNY